MRQMKAGYLGLRWSLPMACLTFSTPWLPCVPGDAASWTTVMPKVSLYSRERSWSPTHFCSHKLMLPERRHWDCTLRPGWTSSVSRSIIPCGPSKHSHSICHPHTPILTSAQMHSSSKRGMMRAPMSTLMMRWRVSQHSIRRSWWCAWRSSESR